MGGQLEEGEPGTKTEALEGLVEDDDHGAERTIISVDHQRALRARDSAKRTAC